MRALPKQKHHFFMERAPRFSLSKGYSTHFSVAAKPYISSPWIWEGVSEVADKPFHIQGSDILCSLTSVASPSSWASIASWSSSCLRSSTSKVCLRAGVIPMYTRDTKFSAIYIKHGTHRTWHPLHLHNLIVLAYITCEVHCTGLSISQEPKACVIPILTSYTLWRIVHGYSYKNKVKTKQSKY